MIVGKPECATTNGDGTVIGSTDGDVMGVTIGSVCPLTCPPV